MNEALWIGGYLLLGIIAGFGTVHHMRSNEAIVLAFLMTVAWPITVPVGVLFEAFEKYKDWLEAREEEARETIRALRQQERMEAAATAYNIGLTHGLTPATEWCAYCGRLVSGNDTITIASINRTSCKNTSCLGQLFSEYKDAK